MKIGLWNIDHPETASGSTRKEERFREVTDYLLKADCDAFVITEANAAISLPGYHLELSQESPFRSSRRFYDSPNAYHQVAIYSKTPLTPQLIAEPINGLHCQLEGHHPLTEIYGNVVTIKDQWSKISSKKYSDRLNEQIKAIEALPKAKTLVGGDFNLRLGWPQKLPSHKKVKASLQGTGWQWPTENRNDTVQHILHSPDLSITYDIDFEVKYDKSKARGLSDHPFVLITI